MAYATPEKLRRRLPESALAQLTRETGDAADDEMLTEVCVESDGILNVAANTAGYTTPVSSSDGSTMGTLETHSLSIAKFLLLNRRGLGSLDLAAETLYKAALKFGEQLACGDMELLGAAVKGIPAATSGSSLAGSEDLVFGKGNRTSDPMRGL